MVKSLDAPAWGIVAVLASCCALCLNAAAADVPRPAVVSPLGRGFSGLYNLDFAGAQKDFATWQELRMTSARILLSIAYVGEEDKPRALELLTGLQREFPTNTVFPRQIAHLRTAH